MREICASKITETVRKLCIEANCYLPQDIKDRIIACRKEESWGTAILPKFIAI